ncbi:voltage-gated chloride channel family protein [Paenibacillus sp. NPDC058071]|uniref:voltage-gated chloride channel family protein n=1 Tax=Paenibacillus sp. NPDC058071 TaxID=3346326 RepID=UPI0036DCC904
MHLSPIRASVAYSIKWLLLGLAVGVAAGSASALFLSLLEWASATQQSNGWLLWLLPFGGALVSYLYQAYGGPSSKGNNLLLERIYDGNGHVPLRMAPLVLFGTIVTHLFGGSAGREGTAVQMGGSLADQFGSRFKLNQADRRILLMCGISSGFGSVFGTPLAGAIFGLEVAALGFLHYRAILPCLVASFAGHYTVLAWGVHHGSFSLGELPALSWLLLAKLIIASILFGLAANMFTVLLHRLKAIFTKFVPNAPLKSFTGGLVVIGLVYALGSRSYTGLSLPLLEQSFEQSVPLYDSLAKLLLTVVTLGSGFQGGEVTPLFVIGSTLGSALAGFLSASVPLLAGIGLIAVFGAAANSPLAALIMGVELFGFSGAGLFYMAVGCSIAYLCSGRGSIYASQRPRFTRLTQSQLEKDKVNDSR